MNVRQLGSYLCSFLVLALICHLTEASPKKYDSGQSESTYSENPWRRSFRAANETANYPEGAASTSNDRTQRLGSLLTTGYGQNSLNGYGGYGGTGIGSYQPYKIDLGGVVLGTLVGIGALLILPKVFNAFSGGYGHYRSVDSDPTGFAEMVNKLDDFLASNNVDSSSCFQKAVCHFVRSSEYHVNVGTADQVEQMILSLSQNSIVDYMIDGTAIKEAIENGKNPNGRDCDLIYPACPLDRQSALDMAKKFFPLPGSQRPNK